MQPLRRLTLFGLGLLFVAASLVGGCSGTLSAYKAAYDPSDYAYVITEHYSALVHEAALLRVKPTTTSAQIAAMQKAELAVRPFVLGSKDAQAPQPSLRELAAAWNATHNATTQADLQAAIDVAITHLVDLVRAVSSAR